MKIHDELILGIDEAGRGPVLGPMVMACVAVRPRRAASLTRAGVTDSKAFAGEGAHEARLSLLPRIYECAEHIEITVVDVAEIDLRCRDNGLNRLEQERAAAMIGRAPQCRRIVCDGHRLFSPLAVRYPHLEALDNGESQHAAVAAASIVAKVRRDEQWARISARYSHEFGDLVLRGGGYTNAATRAFLRAYIEKYRALPPEARRSWPWGVYNDLLGDAFDPWWDVPGGARQLGLFSTRSSARQEPQEPETPATGKRRRNASTATSSSP